MGTQEFRRFAAEQTRRSNMARCISTSPTKPGKESPLSNDLGHKHLLCGDTRNGRIRPEFGQTWPKSGQFRSSPPRNRPAPANLAETQPNSIGVEP